MRERSTCLGCDRTVEGKDYLKIGGEHFSVCHDCQDQLAKNEYAVSAALREVLVATR